MIRNIYKISWLLLAIYCVSIFATSQSNVKYKRNQRDKRQTLGGETNVDPSRFPVFFEKINEALTRLATQQNGETLNLVEIISVQEQVVAGWKYNINAKITLPNNEQKICNFEILEQLWLDYQKFDASCEDKTYQVIKEGKKNRQVRSLVRSIRGGIRDANADDLKYLDGIVTESLVQLGQESSSNYQLVRIKDAQKQTVSGAKYYVNVELSLKDSENQHCSIEIWEQLWLNFRETTVKCDGNEYKVVKGQRVKRSIGNLYGTEFKTEVAKLTVFKAFQSLYNRVYSDEEERQDRYLIFKRNLLLIEQLNKYEMGTAEYGVSEFADLTTDEYFQRTGLHAREGNENKIANSQAEIPNIQLPTSFDWRQLNAVTSVKNQGNCGSCWAFSVTGNIEGVHVAKGGQLVSYSEQELLDCDTVDGACQGGLPDDAYKAIERIGGLETEDEYPYKGHKQKCRYNESLSHISLKGAVDLPKDEDAIAKYLVENGPVSIGINANAMQFYRHGVSHPWKSLCGPNSLDHGVLIVGFGTAQGKKNKTLPYWIVKNSWGPKWGEQGYYRVYRGDNTCGVASAVTSAILE